MGITSTRTGEIPSTLISDTRIHTVLVTIITLISMIPLCTIHSIIRTVPPGVIMEVIITHGITVLVPGIHQDTIPPIILHMHGALTTLQ